MPFLFLSPSTQYFNPYITTGDERYWMNALADEMTPYLHASGITVTRNDPDGSAAQSIRDSNASRQDFHLALHSNAAPQALSGRLRGVDIYYYPTSEAGLRMANILVDNIKPIYPLPDRVQARSSTIIGELRRTRAPAVLAELGYHDNTEDANWLTGNLDEIARVLALGVTEYFGVPFLTPGDEFDAEAAGENGYMALRAYPQTDAEILAQVPNGTAVTVLGDFDGWYTVRAGDVLSDKRLQKEFGGDYDVIVANIVADVIIALAPQVGKLLKKGGIFLCSGIIDDRAEEVREKLVEAGWTIEETRSSEGWFSYLCR